MSCPTVSSPFKVLVAAGLFLSVVDFGTDIAATYDFHRTITDYADRADTISAEISGEEASNFKANSTFFLALSAEYDALSTFDKENVFCDVVSIQSDPNSLEDSSRIVIGACITMGLTVVAHLVNSKILHSYMTKKKISGGVPMDREHLSAPYWKLHQVNLKAALQFAEVGPMLALLTAMIIRHAGLESYSCQEKFYNCGISGDCDMSDLMLTVPLNSSLIDIFTSETVLTVSFVVGLVSLLFNFGSGIGMWIVEGAGKLLLFPLIQMSVTAMPMMCVIWIEGRSPLGLADDAEGKITIGSAILTFVMFFCSMGLFVFFELKGTMIVLGKVRKPTVKDLENPEKWNEMKVGTENALKNVSTGPRSHALYWIVGRCILAAIRFYLCSFALKWDMSGDAI